MEGKWRAIEGKWRANEGVDGGGFLRDLNCFHFEIVNKNETRLS